MSDSLPFLRNTRSLSGPNWKKNIGVIKIWWRKVTIVQDGFLLIADQTRAAQTFLNIFGLGWQFFQIIKWRVKQDGKASGPCYFGSK